jgi:hypothetical protein
VLHRNRPHSVQFGTILVVGQSKWPDMNLADRLSEINVKSQKAQAASTDTCERHLGAGAGGVPDPLWISVLLVALPFVLYLLSLLLLSTRTEELIAAGAGIAAGMSPFSLMFSVTASLGITFFSFSPDPYLLPMAISLLAVFAGSVWIIVSAFRIGKVNWGAFLLAAGVTFFSLAICTHRGMGP